VARQIAVWESGAEVVQQTYDFDASSGTLTPRRTKEEAEDYRYFPEPDLVPLQPPPGLVERLRRDVPELPGTRVRRLQAALDFETANGLVTSGRDRLYQAVVAAGADARATANVVMNQLAGAGVAPGAVNAAELAKLIEGRESIPRGVFDEAIAASGEPGFTAEKYLAEAAVTDVSELDPVIDRVLAANEAQVVAYRGGKEGLLGFFVGAVMRETQGKANPKIVNERLREKLSA
jgi:aspartyl-tRNA(Asn)/glutamyl-tRNA(Gln) amidotransferase subunit B